MGGFWKLIARVILKREARGGHPCGRLGGGGEQWALDGERKSKAGADLTQPQTPEPQLLSCYFMEEDLRWRNSDLSSLVFFLYQLLFMHQVCIVLLMYI